MVALCPHWRTAPHLTNFLNFISRTADGIGMRPSIIAFATVLALSTLSGCAGSSALQSGRFYRSEAHPGIGRSVMLQAARRFLTSNGWTNLRQRSGGYRISAVQPPDRGMREAIILEVKEHGEIMVSVRTQISGEDGRWNSPGHLCESYSYSRERDIVEGIASEAAQGGLSRR